MLGHADEQEHKDLQTSILSSNMDRLILTEIFYKLYSLNLSVVRIDNESFRSNPFPGIPRCGSRYIFKGLTAPDWRSSFDELNPAFDVVITSLMDADATPCMEMIIHIRTPFCEEFFDPTCDKWISDIANNVMDLALFGEVNSEWSLNLLRSTKQLSALEINFASGTLRLSHPETGMLRWPELFRLRLEGVFCDGQVLEDFFGAHKSTLRYLNLSEVHLMSGSWKDMFPIWRTQMSLKHLSLEVLTENTRPSPRVAAFGVQLPNFPKLADLGLKVQECQIPVALDALLRGFRTMNLHHALGLLGSHMFRVDLRMAWLVLAGGAVIRDGKFHLVEIEESIIDSAWNDRHVG